MLSTRQRGVTLLELMVGLGIVALIMLQGAPAFNVWMQNIQSRSAAESVLSGLSLARAEAVRRNKHVRFSFSDAEGKVGWAVGCVVPDGDDCPEEIQSVDVSEGRNARVGASLDLPAVIPANYYATVIAAGTEMPAGVTFDGLGRVPTANAGSDIVRIDITNSALEEARRYVIRVDTAGQARMCDPALDFAKNMQGCK